MAIPGVPSLPSSVTIITDIAFAIADAVGLFSIFSSNPWGIYRDGFPVIVPDNIISIGYKQGWTTADFNIESGGFESYDKVDTPFTNRVRMSSGGSQSNRQSLIEQIDAIAGDLLQYDVVTPEKVWSGVNVEGYELIRTATNGAGMIIIDIQLTEIRIDATSQFTSTKSPVSSSYSDNGTVQGSTISSGEGLSVAPIQ